MDESSYSGMGEDELIGSVVGERYLIETRLGKGAMGVVYRARHVKMSRKFAVKMLHAHLLTNAKLRRRFEREAELAGTLQHANVVNVVDVGETNGQYYLVMEFAEGPSLQQLLGTPFQQDRVVSLARQLLDGLHHAHQHGVIHRDFKPDNIIVETQLDGTETPRIVDFGIARLIEEAPTSLSHGRLTTDGLVLGTPEYMAPEQAMNAPIDLRIDLFALGVILYELLTGVLPFDGTGVDVALANVTKDAPSMRERAPTVTVDPLLEAFTRKLLSRKPDQRPASARAARRILELIETDRATAAQVLGMRGESRHAAGSDPPPIASARMPSELHEVPDDSELRVEVSQPDIVMPTLPSVATRLPPSQQHPSTLELAPIATRARTIAIVAITGVVLGLVLLFALRGKRAEPVAPVHQVAAVLPIDAAVEVQPIATVDAAVEPPPPPVLPTVKPVPPPPLPSRPPPHIPVAPVKPPVIAAVPPPPVVPPRPPAVPVVDPNSASSLATLYSSVGHELKALRDRAGNDVTSDLWRRYLLIQLNEAMSTPARRGAAIEVLNEIRRETLRIQKASERGP